MATLQDILAARDARAQAQRLLLKRHGLPVVSLTVVMPGPDKLTPTSRYIAEVGCSLIEATFPIRDSIIRDTPAGPEAISALGGLGGRTLVCPPLEPVCPTLEPVCPTEEIKRRCTEIEDQHPLGRLLDIDVIAPDGTPISREQLGLPPRRCLVCGAHAHSCVRSQKHTIPEVLAVIEQMVHHYQTNHSEE